MPEGFLSATPLPNSDDFLLPPESFVRKYRDQLGLSDSELDSRLVSVLASAIGTGTSRFQIIACLQELAGVSSGSRRLQFGDPLPEDLNPYVVPEMLARYAKHSDREFVLETYRRILDRHPTPAELASSLHANPDEKIDRLNYIAAFARAHGLEERISTPGEFDGGDGTFAAFPENFINSQGRREIVIVRHEPGRGWIINSSVLVRDMEVRNGKTFFKDDWICSGPKKSLPAGKWAIDIKITQDAGAELVIDVVANAGLDKLIDIVAMGPIYSSIGFTLEDHHHFVEVRVRKGREDRGDGGIFVHNISLVRISR